MVRTELSEATRSLRRDPRFTLGFSLVLGIGMAGVLFVVSLLQATAFKTIPWSAPDQMFALILRDNGVPRQFTVRDALTMRDAAIPRLAISWYSTSEQSVEARGDSSDTRVAIVEPRFFHTLGLVAAEGRLPDDSDDAADQAVVLSQRLRAHLFPAGNAIGELASIGGRRFTVVGVLPRGSEFPLGADAWQITTSASTGRLQATVNVIARDSSGRSSTELQARLTGTTASLASSQADAAIRTTVGVTSLIEEVRPRLGRRVRVILTGICAVILLVLVNLSNALLLRAERRRFSHALRITLGAPVARLMRLALYEIVLLVTVSLALGVALAMSLAGLLRAALGGQFADASVAVDGTWLLGVGVVLLLVIGALALAPLLTIVRVEPATAIQRSSSVGAPVASRMRRIFLGLQVGATVFFLLIAATISLAFARVNRLDLGYAHRDLTFATVGLRGDEYRDPARVRAAALDAATLARQSLASPAVAVWGTTYPHRLALQTESPIQIPERVLPAQDARVLPALSVDVNPEFFGVMGVSLRRGRLFDATDTPGSAPVAIVDDQLAKALWGDDDAIGKSLRLGGRASDLPWMTVVGVVASSQPIHPYALEWELTGTRYPLMYRPFSQSNPTALLAPLSDPGFSIALAAGATSADASRTLERVFAQVLPGERPRFNGQLRDFVDRTEYFDQTLFESVTLGLFGAVGILLALLGVATAVDETLHSRTREIGIRLALGSPVSSILRLVSLGTLRVAIAGALGAMALFAVGGRAMRGLVYESTMNVTGDSIVVSPLFVVAVVGGTLGLVLLIALWRAGRAAGVDPAIAIRVE